MKKTMILILTMLLLGEGLYGYLCHERQIAPVSPQETEQTAQPIRNSEVTVVTAQVTAEIKAEEKPVEKPVATTTGNTEKQPEKTGEKVYFKTSKGFTGYVQDGVTYVDGMLIANKTYSLPSWYGNGLTTATKNAFNKMKADAAKDGITLKIVSGFRSYDYQVTVYNRNVKKQGVAGADTHSARPGHSEHQAGLAMDINSLSQSFENTDEFKWLQENAYKYGFILRYPKGKTGETGYIYEPWHYRYVGEEKAKIFYNNGDWITVESYYGLTSKYSD